MQLTRTYVRLAAAAATMVCLSGVPSSAASFILSTSTNTTMTVGDSATYGSPAVTVSPFNVSWLFQVLTPAVLNAFATTGNSPPASINPMTLAIIKDNDNSGTVTGGDTVIDSTTGTTILALLTQITAPGNYLLRVSGPFSGENSGTVAGTLAMLNTPLPPALALFGTGLAGLVLLSRRRRKDKDAVA